MDGRKKKPLSNVFFIGLISFFGGISQDIFVPILPLYFSNVLGLSKEFIGLAEGLVTSGSSIFKIVAGYLTDKFGKKKPLIFLGYLFSLIARPLLALTTVGGSLLGLRFLDGVGKGMKDPPKDALTADSTLVTTRGKGFGIVRMLDTMGSVAGPLVLFAMLYLLRNSNAKYHIVLLATAIPLFFTLIILTLKVKETPRVEKPIITVLTAPLPRKFYFFVGITLLFGIGNSSAAFLVLRAQNVGITLLAIPLVYALFNFVYASASVPFGILSDRIGREKVIMLGWAAYVISYFGFGFATEKYQIWLLFAFYGLYFATTEGVAKAFVADIVPADRRGRAYGIYSTAVGLVSLPAGIVGGILWDKVSSSAPFFFGGSTAFAALILFIFFYQRTKSRESAQHKRLAFATPRE